MFKSASKVDIKFGFDVSIGEFVNKSKAADGMTAAALFLFYGLYFLIKRFLKLSILSARYPKGFII